MKPYPYYREKGSMIILKCRRCQGTGFVENEQYKICKGLQSHDIQRYFHIPTEDKVKGGEEQQDGCSRISETIECPDCDGAGTLSFDEDEWELQIIDEEEIAGEE